MLLMLCTLYSKCIEEFIHTFIKIYLNQLKLQNWSLPAYFQGCYAFLLSLYVLQAAYYLHKTVGQRSVPLTTDWKIL